MENSVTTNQVSTAESVRTRLVELRKQLGLSSIELAQLLTRVRDEKLYLDWDHSSFESAIADPDIGISRSTAYALMDVWATWVVRFGKKPEEVAQIPYDKLVMIAPVVTETNHEEIFDRAASLSRQDLQHMKAEMKANKELPYKPMPKMWRCNNCMNWKWDAKEEDICKC